MNQTFLHRESKTHLDVFDEVQQVYGPQQRRVCADPQALPLCVILGIEVPEFTFTLRAFIRLLSKATDIKSICQKKKKQQCIAVGTVRMFIEHRSAKHVVQGHTTTKCVH